MGLSLQNLILMDHGAIYQPLDSCMKEFNARKGYNEVTFTTEAKLDNAAVFHGQMKMEKLGLIIWLERSKVSAFMAQVPPANVPDEQVGPLRSLHQALAEVLKTGGDKALLWGIDLNPLKDNLDEMFGGPL
jgi:hypothetical protein